MTPKQEAFVHHYCANGGNGTQAAIAAGYSERGADVTASRLLGNVRIAAAMRAHKVKTAERAQITIESLTLELEKDRKLARDLEQPSAAVSATNAIAKLHGLLAEDRENKRNPLTEVLGRIDDGNGTRPRLRAVK